jgi:hypothetical protein
MKTAEKFALGFAVALLLGCLGSIVAVWITGAGRSFFKPAIEVLTQARRVSELTRKYPFRPPADGIVPEGRLVAYLGVCAKAKPSSDPLDGWLKGPRKGGGPARVADRPFLRGEGASMATAFLRDLEKGLDGEKMSFDEFLWIRNRLLYASAGPPDSGREDKVREEIEELRKMAGDPQTPAVAKKSLEEHIKLLEALPWFSGPASQANRALFARYEDRIAASQISDRCVTLVSDYAVSSPGETRTIVFEGDSEAPAPSPAR